MPLAFYSRSATADFWAEHWAGHDVGELLATAEASPLTALIEAALPAGGQILEAGCGLGQYVILLRRRGRAVTGADWTMDGLRRCRAASPSAPLAAMDLSRLAVKSGALAGYISLGVVEHDTRGPDAILADAARALAPGGRLVLSVPYWNGVRRLFSRRLAREAGRIRSAGGEFYQYAFTRREVRRFLEAHGFRVLAFHPYDPARMWRGVLRRLSSAPAGASVDGLRAPSRARPARRPRRFFRAALKKLLYGRVSLRLFGHMILAVAVKP